jgi:hypothetical protein
MIGTFCRNCFIKNFTSKLFSADDYPKTIAHLKDTPAVVVLIIDLLDFPGSVIKSF